MTIPIRAMAGAWVTALVCASVSVAPVAATGKSTTPLDVCVQGKYTAGVQVFAKDGGKGSRSGGAA